MPIDFKLYPKNWKELRAAVLERANNKCEFCGVENYAYGVRDDKGLFHEYTAMQVEAASIDGEKIIQIILTVAHLDHDEENWDVKLDKLAALCQRCHLRYDVNEKKRRRKEKKAIEDLFNK